MFANYTTHGAVRGGLIGVIYWGENSIIKMALPAKSNILVVYIHSICLLGEPEV